MKIPAEPLNRSRRFYELRTGLKDQRGQIPEWSSYFDGTFKGIAPKLVIAPEDVAVWVEPVNTAPESVNTPVNTQTQSVNSSNGLSLQPIVHKSNADKRKEYRKEWQRKRRAQGK